MATHEIYQKVLDDLKYLELEMEEDSDDNQEIASSGENTNIALNKLDKFRRNLCGINSTNEETNSVSSTNETEDLKTSINLDGSNKFLNLLQMYEDLNAENCPRESIETISKLIAELAKENNCRASLVEKNFFIPLNKQLARNDLTNTSRTQICRAIGNLCYNNDDGRLAFFRACGLQKIFDLCEYCSKLDYKNDSTDEEKKEKNTLIAVVLGCLHNITNENETLRKAAYDLNCMRYLKELIPYLKYFKGILIHFGSCLDNLTEMEEGKEQFTNEKVALKLYENIDEDIVLNLDEHSSDFFEVLTSLNNLEKSKDYLLETGFLEILFNIIDKNLENTELLRQIGQFIASLVVADDKIDQLFEYKDSLVLNRGIDWLVKFQNEQLYVTGAVTIANYMRNDQCVYRILKDPREPHVKMLKLLDKYHLEKDHTLSQINVIHSLLGALRNFCVAVNTRDELLKHEIISIVIPFFKSDTLDIKFKALTIIRLLVKSCTDKTGLDLIFDDKTLDILEKLVENPSQHAGIMGEASRLICYMPIAAKNEMRIKSFCKFELIKSITNQLKSDHLIMLNEALLALNVLVAIDYRSSYIQFKSSNLSESLKSVFQKKAIPIEMNLNAMRLFKFLLEKNDFFTQEELKEHSESFKQAKLSTDVEFLKTNLIQLINLIENFMET